MEPSIAAFLSAQREHANSVRRFLARRCDKSFLVAYIARDPTLLTSLQVQSHFFYNADVGLIVRLSDLDLLPETERQRHVASFRDFAVTTPDAGFMRDDIRTIFRSNELTEIVAEVRDNLLPNLERRIAEQAESYDGAEDPEDHFYWLRSALTEFQEIFSDDAEAGDWLSSGLASIDCLAAELRTKLAETPDREDYQGAAQSTTSPESFRTVFDDVDT